MKRPLNISLFGAVVSGGVFTLLAKAYNKKQENGSNRTTP